MALVIDEAYLPATLSAPPMTDEEFAQFCADNPDYFIEMTADGEILLMPPTYWYTAAQVNEVNRQLGNWNIDTGEHGAAMGPDAGFVLPNGARRSPDASWIALDRLPIVHQAERPFWHLCPNFVVEVRSHSDRLNAIRSKMREWVANGAELAWLIDPERRVVEIYQPDAEPQVLSEPARLQATGSLDGFVLDMRRVWDPVRQK